MQGRFVDHDLDLQSFDSAAACQRVKSQLPSEIAKYQLSFPAVSSSTIDSHDKRRTDFSLYSGTTGSILLYQKMHFAQKYCDLAIDTTLKGLSSWRDPMDVPSFLHGAAGVFAVVAAARRDERLVTRLLARDPAMHAGHFEDALYFGRAGYLYALLYVLHHWPECPLRAQLTATVQSTADTLVTNTTDDQGLIHFAFPRGRGERYLGAAHGAAGVIQALLLARKVTGTQYDDCLRRSLDFIISQQAECGGFPICAGESDCESVQFCQGGPGIAMTLCTAYGELSAPQYLAAAVKCGEDTWRRGLLRKGRGLCHGAAGNGYTFLSLFKATNCDIWQHRALAFADLCLSSKRYDAAVRNYDDPQRLKKGSADHPYSLMEGRAGSLCFYYDAVHPETSAFPGFQL